MSQVIHFYARHLIKFLVNRFDVRAFIVLTVVFIIASSEFFFKSSSKRIFDQNNDYIIPHGNIAIETDEDFSDLEDLKKEGDNALSSSAAISSDTPLSSLPSEIKEEKIVLKRGQRLGPVLRKLGLPADKITFLIKEITRLADPEDLNERKVFYYRKTAKEFDKGILYLGEEEEIHINKVNNLFKVSKITKPLQKKTLCLEGTIRSNLYKDAIKMGIPKRAVKQMIQLLSHEVNFQTDIQPNATFEIMYDQYGSEQNARGDLVYASITVQGEPVRIFRYKTKRGGDQFFNERGASTRKGLLKTPVNGAHISSPYGNRYHPMFHYTKFHKGVDFAAPMGSPVLAAGDGIVTFAGRKGGYGNCIIIRHNEYSTLYGHLSRFGKNQYGKIRQGARVRQGDQIGYVGATGHSTGPHLHFEVHHYGRVINPAKVKHFASVQLSGKELKDFRNFVQAVDFRFNRSRPEGVRFAQNVSKQAKG